MKLPILLLVLACITTSATAAIQYPLSISADGRNVLDSRGNQVMFNAAAPWHIAARLTREETAEYLDARASQGINALLMALMVTDGYSTGSSANAYGDKPFLSPGDFTQPNEAYFAQVDWVIEQANQRGMTMLITPVYLGWECGPEGWCAETIAAGPSVMRDFGRWIGNRYRDQPNIVWVQGGDVDADAYGAMDEVDALVEGIREFDSTHLHTAHCDRQNSARDCYDRPWLDFNTTYSDCSLTPRQIRDDYQLIPWMPTVYIEGVYEFENNISAECVRSQAWWSVLGGSNGHFFGSGKIWDFPSWWRDGLDTDGARSMYNFGRLVKARAPGQLVPDYAHNVLISGYGNIDDSSYAAAATRADRNSILAYIPSARTVTVAMTRVEGVEADAWWIDPALGEGQYIGRFPTTGTREFSTPGPGDWLLIIDNAAANLADVWATSTAVGGRPISSKVKMIAASPNPFNPRTMLSFSGPAGTRIEVSVYDPRGRLVTRLFAGPAAGGVQTLVWDATNQASGTYFVRIAGAGQASVQKVALLK